MKEKDDIGHSTVRGPEDWLLDFFILFACYAFLPYMGWGLFLLAFVLFFRHYFAVIFAKIIGHWFFDVRNKVEVRGLENWPYRQDFGGGLRGFWKWLTCADGIAACSNHQTLLDSILLGIKTINWFELFFRQNRVFFSAPDANNFFKGIGKYFWSMFRVIGVKRGINNKGDFYKQLHPFIEVLEKLKNMLFFPEATRFGPKNLGDNTIGSFRRGMAITILKTMPKYVIPIYLHNIFYIMPIEIGFQYHKIFTRRCSGHKGLMIIGKAIDYSDIYKIILEELRPLREKIDSASEALRIFKVFDEAGAFDVEKLLKDRRTSEYARRIAIRIKQTKAADIIADIGASIKLDIENHAKLERELVIQINNRLRDNILALQLRVKIEEAEKSLFEIQQWLLAPAIEIINSWQTFDRKNPAIDQTFLLDIHKAIADVSWKKCNILQANIENWRIELSNLKI